jgi:hypothetical protein
LHKKSESRRIDPKITLPVGESAATRPVRVRCLQLLRPSPGALCAPTSPRGRGFKRAISTFCAKPQGGEKLRPTVLLILGLFLVQLPQDSGSIEGHVIAAGANTPIVRARVEVRREGGGPQPQAATTDAGGRFAFPNLQPGRYRVTAIHDGYLPAQYGERRRGAQGTVITLESRQGLKNVVLSLTPKSSISGRVFDRYGDPVANLNVQALRYTYQDGRRILIAADTARTNDLGEYRLFWLTPTQYVIRAAAPEAVARAEQPENYLPVYYPGVTDPAAATPIDVQPGANLGGFDLKVSDTRAVRISGRVIDGTTGQPIGAAASVTLVPRRGAVATATARLFVGVSNGAFELKQITPGSYDVVANDSRLAAHVPVEVGNSDIDNVVLVMQPRFDISGRVYVENGQPATTLSLRGVHIELRRDPFTPQLLVAVPLVAADGTFTLVNVTGGDYQVRFGLAGVQGYVKAARYGAVDVLNPPFHIDGPMQGALEILISPNAATLDAIVLDDKQNPFPDATVVLVPEGPRRQRVDLYRAVSSNNLGRIHIEGLTPGDYRLFACDDVPADAWLDADFMRSYEGRGKSVHLEENGRDSVEVQLIPAR